MPSYSIDTTGFLNDWAMRVYDRDLFRRATVSASPALDWMKEKVVPLKGQTYTVNLRSIAKGNNSPDLPAALALNIKSKADRWTVNSSTDPKGIFRAISIYQKDLELSMRDDTSLDDELNVLLMDGLDAIGEDMGKYLWGDGSGEIGQIESFTGSGPWVLTLKNKADVTQFRVDQVGQLTANKTSTKAGKWIVTKVGKIDDGTVTIAEDTATLAPANNDFLIQDAMLNKAPIGFRSFIPTTDPTSTPFLGVDRSIDPEGLGGYRFSYVNSKVETIERAQVKLGMKIDRGLRNNEIDMAWWMHDEDFYEISKEIEAHPGRAVKMERLEGSVGIRGWKIFAGGRELPVFTDPNITPGRAELVYRPSWRIDALNGQLVRFAASDPNQRAADKERALSDAPGFQTYLWSDYLHICSDPGMNGTAKLTA